MRVQEAGVQDGKAGQVPQADALAAPGVGAAGQQSFVSAVAKKESPQPLATIRFILSGSSDSKDTMGTRSNAA